MIDLETANLTIEQKFLLAELRLKEEELALKRKEHEEQQAQQVHERRRTVSPLLLAIIVAGSGMVGSLTGAVTQYAMETRKAHLEEMKFQSSLIFEALKAENNDQKFRNLMFLLDSGLIEDQNGSLAKAIRPKLVPVLPILPKELDRPNGSNGRTGSAPNQGGRADGDR